MMASAKMATQIVFFDCILIAVVSKQIFRKRIIDFDFYCYSDGVCDLLLILCFEYLPKATDHVK